MSFDIHGYAEAERDALVKKMQKLEKSLINTRDENNALRAITRKNARKHVFVEDLLKIFEANVKTIKHKDYAYKRLEPKSTLKWGNVVAMSDWHIGEEVSSKEVNHTNEFNYDIAEKRIKKYVKKIVNSNITKTENLIIGDLGDNIRGIIHNGVTDTEGGLMMSLLRAVELQSLFINEMLSNYNEIDYYSVVGNHSRLDDHILAKGKYQDYSWLITQMLVKLYRNEPRITFNVSETGYHLVKVNGANLGMFHGDTVRSYNPVSESSVLKIHGIFVDLYGVSVKHFLSGHKHIATTVQNRYMGLNIISGCLVGNNEYGVQSGFGTINVSQPMFHVDKEGGIEELSHFNLK
jgi:hypothetical protein